MDWSILLAISLIAVIVYKLGKGATSPSPTHTIQDECSVHINQGLENCTDISNSIRQLHDKELVVIAKDLQRRGDKIMTYLRQHPQSIPAAQRFIHYYLDRTAMLLRQCVTLEQAGISSPESRKIMQQTKETMQEFAVAYEKQFLKITKIQLNDMDAELDVARQILEEDGIEKGTRLKEEKKEPTLPAVKPAESNSWLTPKTIGTVALTVLGAVGLYKLFGNNKDEK